MKTLIAIPCMDTVNTKFFMSILRLHKFDNTEISLTESSLIYDARNQLSRKAVEEEFDRVLWLDSDMVFQPDLMERLSKRLDEGYEMVCGFYTRRKKPVTPVIFKECGAREEGGKMIPFASSFELSEMPFGIFEIAACGFGGCMMNVSLLKEVVDKFGLPFSPILGFGEDLSFCIKVSQLGKKMWCDSDIKMGHIGYHIFTEDDLEGDKYGAF